MIASFLQWPRWPALLWLGWAFTPLIHFLHDYVFNDGKFLVSLALVVGVDTVLGFWRALVERRVSSRHFAAVFQKVIFYALFLIAVHAVARHRVNGELNTLLTWLDSAAYSLILVRELLSIIESATALRLFVAPQWLTSRLAQFTESGTAPKPLSHDQA